MRIVSLITLLLFCAVAAFAQTASEEDDKSFIENWLEENLSEAGRQVIVTGFRGALSSNATLDSLTISDEDGVWFTLRDASIVWSRSALLRGRLDVTELVAGEMVLARLPKTEGAVEPEDSQAWTFKLPDLPVAIDIEKMEAKRITLEEPVIGEAANLSLEGALFLDDGVATADLKILRLDRDDSLVFAGAFSNETRVLALDLDFVEAKDGLVSKLLRIPGGPALGLQLEGEAPLSDFTARLALSSDGVRRFGGTVQIATLEQEGSEAGGHSFLADLSGDVRPLFKPEFHPFMGENATLAVAGESLSDGRLMLDTLRLASGAMDIAGQLALAADGWPESFDFQARISGDGPTRLPVSGAELSVGSAQFTAGYDALAGDSWRLNAVVDALKRDGLAIGRAELVGDGTITRGGTGEVVADLAFEAKGLRHEDDDLARAIGTEPRGRAKLRWSVQSPLLIEALSVISGDVSLEANGRLDGLADGFPVSGQASIRSADLDRFSGLAGRDLSGVVKLDLSGDGALLGGAFDLELMAETADLVISDPRIDPLLAGRGALMVTAARNTTGTTLEQFTIKTPAVDAEARGRLTPESGQLDLRAGLTEISLVEPRMSGPANVSTRLSWQNGGALTLEDLRFEALAAVLTGQATLMPEDPEMPVEGRLLLESQDLSRLSEILARPLSGQATWRVEGGGSIESKEIDLTTDLQAKGFTSGNALLDRLVAGDLDFKTSFALGDAAPHLRYLNVDASGFEIDAQSEAAGAPIVLAARLADIGVFAPEFSGPAAAEGQITVEDQEAKRVLVALSATGPAGTQARITGRVDEYAQRLALDVLGSAPLGLVNALLDPVSVAGLAQFDLRVDGPAALGSISGTVTATNGRVVLPRAGFVLEDLQAGANLSAGRAVTEVTGSAGAGGSFRVTGPITLTASLPASLDVTLSRLRLRDPNLFETTVDGGLTVEGPLTGGARIGGSVSLGTTELVVPSGSSVTPGSILDVKHVNTPKAVRITQDRAGLNQRKKSGPAVAFPLDVLIRAPNQIFVRGRGLDAELGGRLRLGGTTANVTASGVFELIRGRLDILGRRLVLTEGLIDLRGALDPFLRFVAETQSDEFIVRVIIEGLASEPAVRFESDPDLPQEEAVARLLFGRGLESISPFQAAQLVSAAATLSGQRSGGLVGNLRSTLGLSDLDVTTTEDGANQLRAGAYINDNLYSEVTVDSEGNQEINLNLDINRSLTVRGGTNSEGNTGVGIFFEKDY